MTDCDLIADAVAEGRVLTEGQRRHVTSCRACELLTADDAALASMVRADAATADTDAMPAALRAAVEGASSPVRSFSAWRRAVRVMGPALAFAMAAIVWRPRADLAHRPMAWVVVGVAALASLVALGAWTSLSRGARGLGASVASRAAVLVAIVLGSLAALSSLHDAVEGSRVVEGSAAVTALAHCAFRGVTAAALAAVLVGPALRRTAVTAPTLTGALGGAVAGLAGALTLHVMCPVAGLAHALVGHGTPVVLGAVLGALVGRRFVAV